MAINLSPYKATDRASADVFNEKQTDIQTHLNNLQEQINTLTQQLNNKVGEITFLSGTSQSPGGVVNVIKNVKVVNTLLNIKIPNPLQFGTGQKQICKLSFVPASYATLTCSTTKGINSVTIGPDGIIYTWLDLFTPGEVITIFGTYMGT